MGTENIEVTLEPLAEYTGYAPLLDFGQNEPIPGLKPGCPLHL